MAADVWDVPAESIEVSSPESHYKVKVETDERREHRLRSIVVLWDGNRLEVPASELDGIDKVKIQSLRVITDRPMRTPGIPKLNNRFLAVCLEYGNPVQTMTEAGKEELSFPKVFFVLIKHGYSARMRHVPVVKAKRWKLFGKDIGKEEEESGEATEPMDAPFGWPVREKPRSDEEL
jgi:hypothetical protein